MQIRRNRRGDEPRATAAVAGRDADVLPAVDGERDREPLNGGCQPGLPQHLAAPHVERPEPAIEIAGEHDAARSRDGRGHEGRALRVGPRLFQGPNVEGSELADVAVGARHFVEPTARTTAAAAAFLLLDALRADVDAALTERNDDLIR